MSKTVVTFNQCVRRAGFGAVAQCARPILVKHLRVPLAPPTALDGEDQTPLLPPWLRQGVAARRLVRDHNATARQAAIAILAAVLFKNVLRGSRD